MRPFKGVRWNRCKPDCGCNGNPSTYDNCKCLSINPKNGKKSGGCLRGSADRRQLIAYAISVNLAVMGPVDSKGLMLCPLTGNRFHFLDGEIDKVNPALGYIEGNVIMVSLIGNNERGILQGKGMDIGGIARYAIRVRNASRKVALRAKVSIPPYPQRRRTTAKYISPTAANVLSGPFGK